MSLGSHETVASNIEISAIKNSMNQDGTGLLKDIQPSPLISKDAVRPITIDENSFIGDTSIRFELNSGDCGEEPKWSDCNNGRERTELIFAKETPREEKWYRFYLFFPSEHKQSHPSKLSIIQWKRFSEPSSTVLVMFQHLAGGLVFNRNGGTFVDSYVQLVGEENLYNRWIEIVFNTNWNPSREKGYMRVWVDGKLSVNFKGRSHSLKAEKLSLRYGLYSSWVTKFKLIAPNENVEKRVVYIDGVKATKKCSDIFEEAYCGKLENQEVATYQMFKYRKNKRNATPEDYYTITADKLM